MDNRTVMIVEDDAETRSRLSTKVSDCPGLSISALAGSCAEAREQLDVATPDVLLVDLGLPDGDGSGIIELASAMPAEIAIMVITVFGDEERVMRAIRSGATGYLLKSDTSQDICSNIQQLLAGGSPISPVIARYLIRNYHAGEGENKTPEVDLSLSERELDVLRLSAKGYTYQEVANLLNLSVNTIGTHTRSVYRKLAVNSRSEAVYEATRLGLVSAPRND